eukprot:397338-Pleurochrysis_carterae.AAC.1
MTHDRTRSGDARARTRSGTPAHKRRAAVALFQCAAETSYQRILLLSLFRLAQPCACASAHAQVHPAACQSAHAA